MVPRFSTRSASVIPMPVSAMVMVLFSLSVVTVISRGLSGWEILESVSCFRRSFSRASEALETSSRTKISRSL